MNETGRVIAKDGLHLRQRPDANSRILYTLREDATVKIEEQHGNWYQVKTAWGERGYVYSQYVAVIPSGPAPPDVELPPLPDVKVRPLFRTWTEAAVSAVIIFGLMVLLAWCSAHAYDYTSDLHRECLEAGLKDASMFGVPLCEVATVEPLTKDEAVRRKLFYRAVGWGKHMPPQSDGYYIAKSGEFIPDWWSVPSPDGDFHRCTFPLNHYWSGPPDHKWKVLPSTETADGLPPTRCFWRPK